MEKKWFIVYPISGNLFNIEASNFYNFNDLTLETMTELVDFLIENGYVEKIV